MPRGRVSTRCLARWLRGEGRLADALGVVRRDQDVLVWRAYRLLEAGALEDARRLFELAGLLWSDSRVATLGAGVCAQLEGRFDDAERLYGAVLAEDPEDLYALANRAEVRLLCGRQKDARTDLEGAAGHLAGRVPADLRRRFERLLELARDGTG